jgi:Lon protease-like protein
MADLRIADLPPTVYLLPVDRFILLPQTTLPMTITEPRSQQLLEAAESAGGYLGVIQARPPEEASGSRFFEVGCLGRIRSLAREAEGHRVALEGVIRFRVREELADGGGAPARARVAYEEFARDLRPVEEEDLEGWDMEGFRTALLRISRMQSGRDATSLESMTSYQLVRMMAQTVPLAVAEKQALLETHTFRELLELLFQLLAMNFLTTTPDTSTAKTN